MRRFSKIAAVARGRRSFALAGCGKDDDEHAADDGGRRGAATAGGDGPKVGLAYDVGGRGDQSFNDAAWAGMEKADRRARRHLHRGRGRTRRERRRAREERLRTLADAGLQPDHRGRLRLHRRPSPRSPPEYPDINFAVVDGFDPCRPATASSTNVANLTFAEKQGSFLVGVAAALKTETDHVGFVGGVNGPLIKKFEAGYIAGVEAVDPSIKVDVKYLTEEPTRKRLREPGRWQDRRRRACTTTAPTWSTTPPASPGSVSSTRVEAAGEGNWAIGVDSDQYLTAVREQQPHILTSMLKRVDVASFDYVKAFDDGKPPTGYVRSTTWPATASATPPPVASSTTSQDQTRRVQASRSRRRDQGARPLRDRPLTAADRPGQHRSAGPGLGRLRPVPGLTLTSTEWTMTSVGSSCAVQPSRRGPRSTGHRQALPGRHRQPRRRHRRPRTAPCTPSSARTAPASRR